MKKDNSQEKEALNKIEELFQETMKGLEEFHEEKMKLIKKFRDQKNSLELENIRKSLNK